MQRFEYRDDFGVTITATAAELRKLAEDGAISPTTPLRQEGAETWHPASKVRGLQFHVVPAEVLDPGERGPEAEPPAEDTPAEQVQAKWQSKNKSRWSHVARAASILSLVYTLVGVISLPLGVAAVFLGATLAGERVLYPGLWFLSVFFALWPISVVFEALELFARDRADSLSAPVSRADGADSAC